MAEAEQTEKLRTLIEESGLSKEDGNAFLNVLILAEAKDLDQLISLFEEDPQWIEWLYENYKAKVEAFKNNNEGALEQIRTDEQAKLERDN